ncbi:polyprenol monophosphomannose synthase [Salegentibacter mishustinae]|jgi:dolichol-phosphate mannosyltransferase|uniref:Dolichyl-phosphate beta-D-mannosyltransferase n=1 Tax=Salegentibacter mishustinae TaxID=270918 RepID=A0A0Q9Z4V6_9FLAO|nr:polyprenol monophosphomannose synthase [Salegentibacter mishustinae]KRG27916.1 dolichyl-phosphate beta-D-mannosyltransferase [Salegentibacter mishustinae]PNW20984.1 dolichyl-phosphate beta-D-mannosyltransferase [Salegentibacter mishustinae]PZX63997.1 dolichol-phosphate mannosyltransferase [Salegentibacter mishustinae]UBZ08402.1 polyprenol monophosphomannose synthase [Salegentibacter mishustinae]GGW89463.1 dolichyl-phosphate beta-D-mannosyltransferase [Salegentibacter mishustinae]|tara:strand:- start:1839 stop:2573 length:735 start_codon:yes stop_codon:yes gene_type:complete
MVKGIVIVPTFNEIENIERLVRNVFSQQKEFHILVVDDNSPDGTATRVRTLQAEFHDNLFLEERMGKLGLGTAYIHGFKWALQRDYEYVFEMDADFSHNPNDLVRLFNTCKRNDADVAIGSRYVTGVNVINWPMSRVLLSWLASKYVRFITGMDIHDTTAGFVCYKRKVLETIDLDSIQFVGYAFQIEMKFKAYLLKYRLEEVPVIFTDRTRGTSKMSGSIISEAIFGVIIMKIKSLFKQIKLK